MKNWTYKDIILSWPTLIIVVVICYFSVIWYEKHTVYLLFNDVKNHQRLYVYQTYSGDLDQVFYVEDIKDTGLLIDYYNRLSRGDTAVPIEFDYHYSMPVQLVVPTTYVYKYKKGSKIIELIDFNVKCWGYNRGYVYLPTTHTKAPPQDLIKKWLLRLSKTPSGEVGNPFHYGGGIHFYGWYCDD